jgi:hypothetical protein
MSSVNREIFAQQQELAMKIKAVAQSPERFVAAGTATP